MPLKESGPEIAALPTGDVPLPINIPPKVVEPVPPKLTASVVLPTTFPLVSVVRIEEVMEGKKALPRTVKLLVEAFAKY